MIPTLTGGGAERVAVTVLGALDGQRHARAVEQHPAMGRSNGELLTDFVSLQAGVLAEHEDLRRPRRQPGKAGFQRLQELLLVQRTVGVFPGLGVLAPVLALVEERVEVGGRRLGVLARERALAARAADRIDALVLEDPGDPGPQVGAALKACLRRERGEQRFLHRVLGRLAVAQLQRGVAHEIGPQRLDLGPEIGLNEYWMLLEQSQLAFAELANVPAPGSLA